MRNPCTPAAHVLTRAAAVLMASILLSTQAVALDIQDADITMKVEHEMLVDPVAPFDGIDVSTEQGIVTLSGTVDNLLARERATRIAETVRGVRSVVNLVEVSPSATRTAEQLRKDIRNALFYDSATESFEIGVSAADDGAVTLTGTVDSWAERSLAERVAASVAGVTAVTNAIAIDRRTDRPDSEIQPEIAARLQWDTLVDDGLVDVRVQDGKAILSGTVGSAAEKRRAEWDTWMVPGVEDVDASGLKVEKWARDDALRDKKYVDRSDAEIVEAILAALRLDPRVNAFDVMVTSRDAHVTLSGIVGNVEARKAAYRDARNTVGVVGVNNQLKVRPPVSPSDEVIATNIRDALRRNPFTEAYEVMVRSDDGVVRLTGRVDSYFEKAEAEEVASRAAGVTRVRNDLEVANPVLLTYDPYVYGWSIYGYPWYEGAMVLQDKTDREILESIESELWWSPFVDSDDVQVRVTGGVATLEGTVESWSEHHAARENALEGGALAVINGIDVR